MMRFLKGHRRGPKPGRFTMPCACAVQDREFVATWVREEGETLYRLVSVAPAPPRTKALLDLVQGMLKPPPALRVAVEELDQDGEIECPGCKASRCRCLCVWCHAFVCLGRMSGEFFVCRESCGASFMTQNLDAFDGQAGGAAPGGSAPRLGGSSVKFLPRR